MKRFFFLALLSTAFAADVTVDGTTPSVVMDGAAFPSRSLDNAARATATGPLVFGALGRTAGAWAGKVVLLDRGGSVSFADKVRRAREAGAVAVVIINNEGGVANDGTLAPESSTIPAVTISQMDGLMLKMALALAAVPDPAGRAGEFLYSDGGKLVYSKNAAPNPSISFSQTVDEGKLATFTVDSWPAPTAYQWSKNGVVIAGATTAVLVYPSAKVEDSGSYICVVTNANGTTASRPATLLVKPK